MVPAVSVSKSIMSRYDREPRLVHDAPPALCQLGHFEPEDGERALHAVPVAIADVVRSLSFVFANDFPSRIRQRGHGVAASLIRFAQDDRKHGFSPPSNPHHGSSVADRRVTFL